MVSPGPWKMYTFSDANVQEFIILISRYILSNLANIVNLVITLRLVFARSHRVLTVWWMGRIKPYHSTAWGRYHRALKASRFYMYSYPPTCTVPTCWFHPFFHDINYWYAFLDVANYFDIWIGEIVFCCIPFHYICGPFYLYWVIFNLSIDK